MSRSILYCTSSLRKAFLRLEYYRNYGHELSRKFIVRLEISPGVRRTYVYSRPEDVFDSLSGSFVRFVSLNVSL